MFEQTQNLNQALLAAMDTHADKACFKIKKGRHFQDISYRDFQILTFQMLRFLRAQGFADGERVAMIVGNCLEWLVVYVASLFAKAVVVPLRPSLAPNVLRFTLQDSGARLVVLDNEYLLQTILGYLDPDENQLPDLKSILLVGETEKTYPEPISISTILSESDPIGPGEVDVLRNKAADTSHETLASIHYTAGETGRSKGAVFDHGRILKTLQHINEWFPLEEDDLAFTIMPWTYTTSLNVALHYFLSGTTNVLSDPGSAAAENMQQTSPTVMVNLPLYYERFYDRVMDEIVGQMPGSSQEVFHWAVAKGKEFHAAGPAASAELREEYARADMTFFSKIRGYIGGRMRRLHSVGAPLSEDLAGFFEAIKLPVLNLYSVTEAGGFPTISRLDARRLGSCGQVAPGFEIKLGDDGELLVKGETTMCEYWGWPQEMQQVLDSEGWLHTGDIGRFDEDGYLYLTGRKQPVMVLSTGRKIMPATIENALMMSPFVDQAVVFGEGHPYVSAMIIPNLEALASHFQEDKSDGEGSSISEIESDDLMWFWPREAEDLEPITTTAHSMVRTLIGQAVNEVNSQLDRWEQIHVYSLLDQAYSKTANEFAELMPENRHQIAERYANQIKLMYPSTAQLEDRAVTQVDVHPERMRQLLEKENILDAWMADAGIKFLIDLAREKQIDGPAMVNICDAAATIAQTESEEKPLTTAIIVGDPTRIAHVLPASQIRLLRHDHIRRMRRILIALAKMVDGYVLGYVVDRHGFVRGINKLDVTLKKQRSTSFLLGPQFGHHAAISQQCQALVFFVPTGGRQVRVFANGQLVGRYSHGDWSPDNLLQVDKVIAELSEQKNYNQRLIQRVLGCAFQMSEENLGAIYVIGNADQIFKHSDAPEISHYALIGSDEVSRMTNRELINFAKQDGATVLDTQGRFRGCMVLLRPAADTEAEIGAGQGARHSSAAKMSAEAQCLAITVSQDGPITVYESGKRVLSL